MEMYLNMKKLARIFTPALLTSLILGCGGEEEQSNKSIPIVQTMVLEKVDHYDLIREYVGQIKAVQNTQLGFELGGKIEMIALDLGAEVKKGDKLAHLDTKLLQTELAQFKAQLEQIDAQLKLVQSNLVRQQQLKEKGFSSKAELDSLKSQRDAFYANKRQIQAAVASNQLRMDKSVLYAPFDGTISRRHLSVGDIASVGQPIFTLQSSEQYEAVFGIPHRQVEAIEQMAKPANIRIGDQMYDAKLLNQGAAIDPNTRSVTLRYQLLENIPVFTGEYAYLQQSTPISQPGFWLPISGLTEGLRGTWNVFVVVPSEASSNQYQVERRAVNVNYTRDTQVFVSGDLQDKDRVISHGLHRVVAGQSVDIAKDR